MYRHTNKKITKRSFIDVLGQKFAMIEEKVLLTYIFRKFKVTSLQTRNELRPCGELILRPEKGIFVSMERRSSQ